MVNGLERRHPAATSTDWNAGVLACNVAFFSDVKLRRSQIA
jgi:hypothetical protein